MEVGQWKRQNAISFFGDSYISLILIDSDDSLTIHSRVMFGNSAL